MIHALKKEHKKGILSVGTFGIKSSRFPLKINECECIQLNSEYLTKFNSIAKGKLLSLNPNTARRTQLFLPLKRNLFECVKKLK